MKKLYVLCRKDLKPAYRAVQAGHAVAEWLLRGPRTEWKNGTLIVLGVSGQRHLKTWKRRLDDNNIPYKEFREPDIRNQTTALAAVHTGEIFRNLSLL